MRCYKCDICGREMKEWLNLLVTAKDLGRWTPGSESRLRKYEKEEQICEDCYVMLRYKEHQLGVKGND